jgi:acyl carrier protein
MKNEEIFLANFRELFDETAAEEIQLNTVFKDLDEWSSLIVLSLIVHFEDNYKVKLAPSDITDSETIEDLYRLIP